MKKLAVLFLLLVSLYLSAQNTAEIAPGVRWYLDPERARVDGNDNGLHRAYGKTAAVLETKQDLDELVSYQMQVYLRGEDKPIGVTFATFKGDGPALRLIYVTEAFDSKGDIERVEITRQRFRISRIDNVPVRIDLLPK